MILPPAPLVEVTATHTKVTLFSYRDLKHMNKQERIRTVYLHACLKYVSHEKTTNSSIRLRFGIEDQNIARASRLIREAVDDGWIALREENASPRYREYVPFWALAESRPLT